MFPLGNVILVAGSSTIGLIIVFTVKYIRPKHVPKLIPARASNYSVQVSPATEQESGDVSKLIEWARRPPQCAYHVGYLEKLPKTQSIPSGCLNCYKLIKCLGSWKNGNNRTDITIPQAT